MKRNTRMTSKAKSERSGLHIKRETIRALSATESTRVLGGMRCRQDSGPGCNEASVCTITLDSTL